MYSDGLPKDGSSIAVRGIRIVITYHGNARKHRRKRPEKKKTNLYCISESRACYLDGIQVVFGTTVGNGRLEVRDSDEAAFNFYDRESGKSVRLAAAVMPEGLSRDEKRDFILTAPLDEVFTQTPVRFEAPPDLPPKKKR